MIPGFFCVLPTWENFLGLHNCNASWESPTALVSGYFLSSNKPVYHSLLCLRVCNSCVNFPEEPQTWVLVAEEGWSCFSCNSSHAKSCLKQSLYMTHFKRQVVHYHAAIASKVHRVRQACWPVLLWTEMGRKLFSHRVIGLEFSTCFPALNWMRIKTPQKSLKWSGTNHSKKFFGNLFHSYILSNSFKW